MVKHLLRFVCGSLLLSTLTFAETEADQAIALVNQASALITEKGIDAAKESLSKADGPFVKGELYVFAYDLTGTMVAHPKNPKLIGKNLIEVPDVDGKLFRKDIIALANEKGSGWVDYKYKNPETSKVEAKTTFVLKAGTVVLCCGIYK